MLRKLRDYFFGSYTYNLGEGFGLGCGVMIVAGILAFIGAKVSRPLEFVAMLFFWLGLVYIVANPFVVISVRIRDKWRSRFPRKASVGTAPPILERDAELAKLEVLAKIDESNLPWQERSSTWACNYSANTVKQLVGSTFTDLDSTHQREWTFADNAISIELLEWYYPADHGVRKSLSVKTTRGDEALSASSGSGYPGWRVTKFIRGPWLDALCNLKDVVAEKALKDYQARLAAEAEQEATRLRIERGE